MLYTIVALEATKEALCKRLCNNRLAATIGASRAEKLRHWLVYLSTNGCGPEVSSFVKWPELEKGAEIVKLQEKFIFGAFGATLYSLFQPTAFFMVLG